MARSAKYVIAAFGQGLRDNIVNLWCKPYSGMKWLSADHALAFLDRQDLVRFDLLDDVGRRRSATESPDVPRRLLAQTEMNSQVVLRQVA